MDRYIDRLVDQMTAFDAGTYSIEDMRQALKDDADFELEVKWVEDRNNET